MKSSPTASANDAAANRASRFAAFVLLASPVCILAPAPAWLLVALIVAQAAAVVYLCLRLFAEVA